MKALFLVLLLLPGYLLSAQSQQLTVVFTNVASSKGNILINVVDEKGQTVSSNVIPAREGKSIFKIDLPIGEYAVKAFHDINRNEELDKNLVGAPVESYGFSMDARGQLGPPDLEDQLFILDRDMRISIKLQ